MKAWLKKLRWSDGLILLVLLWGGAVSVTSHHLLSSPHASESPHQMDDSLEVMVLFHGVDEATRKKIRVGDKERDKLGQVLTEILKLYPGVAAPSYAQVGDETYLPVDNDLEVKVLPVHLKLYGYLEEDSGKFRYKRSTLWDGSDIQFQTDAYSLSGVVQPFHFADPTTRQDSIEVLCRFDRLPQETLQRIQPGDLQRDRVGRVLAEVLEVLELKGFSPVAKLDPGVYAPVQIEDSLRDLLVRMRLYGYFRSGDDRFYYRQQWLRVEARIDFKTETYAVTGTLQADQQRYPGEFPATLEVACLFESVQADLSSKVQVGDMERDLTGRPVAELLEVFFWDSNRPLRIRPGNLPTSPIHPKTPRLALAVRLRLHGMYHEERERFYFKRVMISEDHPLFFRTDRYALRGTLLPGMPERLELLLQEEENDPELLALIQAGDSLLDDFDYVIGTVLETVVSPRKKLHIRIALNAWTRDGAHYWRRQIPLLVGGPFSFQSDRYSFEGKILRIEEAAESKTP